ncbi:MAG: alpha-amylase [Sphingomonas sp.]|uniref:alpha-amylase family glycosyl hydrolase n=1 Tax=Sphingomonas sp. TaxID=28214 RepID=UPI00120AC3E9|nr:alpha-amylase family glycosyl hydrolase [Sphingomonas sp.]THD35247.1 MAG: alpha-amylase [Sphingomonas sp.]
MIRRAAIAALLVTVLVQPAASAPAPAASYRDRLPEDEVIYFVLPDRFENGDPANDRGGLTGDRLVTGFDPTAKGFYHGGDLKGLVKRLDYIQALGATALWVGPIFKNKAVQGPKGDESAGYHGYWITDFTRVDPHFGTNADFKALVEAAHARGMKVYMDIIANHTADVIKYRECVPDTRCAYRSRADYPYTRRGGVTGPAINPGFTGENYAKLTDPTWAYTPYLPKGEENAKTPAWLNDPRWYHNRGDSNFLAEDSQLGDFSGLDDLMTENPRVIAGMIDIYGKWIDDFGVDGFRIDTAQHVDAGFWQAFVPAMLARAKAKGIPHFHIFGEIFTDQMDPARLAEHTRVDKLPAVLDFAFMRAVIDTVGGSAPTSELFRLFFADPVYENGEAGARTLPTFLGNHDAGRFAQFVKAGFPKASDDEILKRVMLGHAMLLTLRGVPTIYYGDEQGFVSKGGDQLAREDMFGSKVAVYNDETLLGTTGTTATPRFGTDNPIFRLIAELSRIRTSHHALTRGRQELRAWGDKPGLFAVSRFDPDTGKEVLIAFNTSTAPVSANVLVDQASKTFLPLHGECALKPAAPGSLEVKLAPLDFVLCAAG